MRKWGLVAHISPVVATAARENKWKEFNNLDGLHI